MGFATYPALSIRQPDFGRTLAIVAAMKTAKFKNQLLRRKMERENEIRGLTGEAVSEMFQGASASAAPEPGGIGTPMLSETGVPTATSTPAAPAGADVFQGRKVPSALRKSPALLKLFAIAPGKVLNIMKVVDVAEGRDRDKIKRDNEKAGAMLAWFMDLPEEQKPLVWPQLRAQAEKEGINVSNVPKKYAPRMADLLYAQTVGTDQYINMVERREKESTFTMQTAKGPIRIKPTGPYKDALALDLEPGTKEFKDYIRKRTLKGGTTPAQQSSNAEIDNARRTLEGVARGLPPKGTLPQELGRRSEKLGPTGRAEVDYAAHWQRLAWLAQQVKTGERDDVPVARAWQRRLMGMPAPSSGTSPLTPGASRRGVSRATRDLPGIASAEALTDEPGMIERWWEQGSDYLRDLMSGGEPEAGGSTATELPRAAGGKIDRARLKQGTVYAVREADGTVRHWRWDGQSFHPVQ